MRRSGHRHKRSEKRALITGKISRKKKVTFTQVWGKNLKSDDRKRNLFEILLPVGKYSVFPAQPGCFNGHLFLTYSGLEYSEDHLQPFWDIFIPPWALSRSTFAAHY
ncbi:hypothetical protein CDAR_469051 [Caerostris darwini]|uniref:40S ribosomal protein S8 n=1 Tax=Caerostris darwini TaxID=1538125 RepID=A0AAV4VGC8_9ARAC|nr:hypothetical protein CDAR_469051 [Caerostris darwini]